MGHFVVQGGFFNWYSRVYSVHPTVHTTGQTVHPVHITVHSGNSTDILYTLHTLFTHFTYTNCSQ